MKKERVFPKPTSNMYCNKFSLFRIIIDAILSNPDYLFYQCFAKISDMYNVSKLSYGQNVFAYYTENLIVS